MPMIKFRLDKSTLPTAEKNFTQIADHQAKIAELVKGVKEAFENSDYKNFIHGLRRPCFSGNKADVIIDGTGVFAQINGYELNREQLPIELFDTHRLTVAQNARFLTEDERREMCGLAPKSPRFTSPLQDLFASVDRTDDGEIGQIMQSDKPLAKKKAEVIGIILSTLFPSEAVSDADAAVRNAALDTGVIVPGPGEPGAEESPVLKGADGDDGGTWEDDGGATAKGDDHVLEIHDSTLTIKSSDA